MSAAAIYSFSPFSISCFIWSMFLLSVFFFFVFETYEYECIFTNCIKFANKFVPQIKWNFIDFSLLLCLRLICFTMSEYYDLLFIRYNLYFIIKIISYWICCIFFVCVRWICLSLSFEHVFAMGDKGKRVTFLFLKFKINDICRKNKFLPNLNKWLHIAFYVENKFLNNLNKKLITINLNSNMSV